MKTSLRIQSWRVAANKMYFDLRTLERHGVKSTPTSKCVLYVSFEDHHFQETRGERLDRTVSTRFITFPQPFVSPLHLE